MEIGEDNGGAHPDERRPDLEKMTDAIVARTQKEIMNPPNNEVKDFVMQFLRDKDCHTPCEACEYDADAIIERVREEIRKGVEGIKGTTLILDGEKAVWLSDVLNLLSDKK